MATNYRKLVQQMRSERDGLQREIDRLTQAIDALGGASGRRGGRGRAGKQRGGRRRGMSAAARRAVSLRMKKYWAARRKASQSK